MSMNRMFSFGLLVATMATGAAHAAVQAKFHLPVGAHWGEVTLAPGDYQVSLPEPGLGVWHFTVKGDDKTGYIRPMATDYEENLGHDSSHNYLQLVKVNGTYYVAKYQSGVTGKMFSFAVPKRKHQLRMSDREAVNVGASSN